MLESYYENKLRTGVQKLGNGVRCLKFESPGFSGVPDRIILLPGAKVIFVEMKKPGKRNASGSFMCKGYCVRWVLKFFRRSIARRKSKPCLHDAGRY